MQFDTDAIVCSIRSHGEHGTIVRMLTPGHGLVAAYVRGGRGRRMRPVLIAGNLVLAQIRSRTEMQDMMDQIQQVLKNPPEPSILVTKQGNCFATRALAWATGEISTGELHESLKDYAQHLGIKHVLPVFAAEDRQLESV